MSPSKLLHIAYGVALDRMNNRRIDFRFGAVGLRADGKLVTAFNDIAYAPTWNSHAESRLCRKITPGTVVAVVRVLKSGEWSLAKPCPSCELCLRRKGVKRVYYSIANSEYGVLDIH